MLNQSLGKPYGDIVLTVTAFNGVMNETLSQFDFIVQGEISNYKISQNKWVTFDLKDENSRVGCFLVKFKLNIYLEDGMQVKVFGSPGIYVPYGKYTFKVNQVEPVGEGTLKKFLEATKKQLEMEGLFDNKYKKSLPKYPCSIGIISSEEAAAYTDVIRVLDNRSSGLSIILKHVNVQGVHAVSQICEAVEYFNKYYPVDVIILTRGGGSLEDLQAFNSQEVCRSIFGSSIPIITGVGHERDITLVDYVADKRASTPSNAAEIVVRDKKEIMLYLENTKEQLISYVENKLEYNLDLVDGYEQLLVNALELKLDYWQNKLSSFSSSLENLNPINLLAKGYSIVYDSNNKIVKDVSKIKKGEQILTRIFNGKIVSIVDKKERI